MTGKKRTHVFISGRVQGVAFRASTRRKAKKLGISGWVRNLSDGRVEAVFEGEKNKIEQLIEWCRRGPIGARVTDLKFNWEKPEDLENFGVRY
ncbi:MAG: acylphosphatase [Candidatus Aenigmatarchaeota archaeon]